MRSLWRFLATVDENTVDVINGSEQEFRVMHNGFFLTKQHFGFTHGQMLSATIPR